MAGAPGAAGPQGEPGMPGSVVHIVRGDTTADWVTCPDSEVLIAAYCVVPDTKKVGFPPQLQGDPVNSAWCSDSFNTVLYCAKAE
jgi:hypothetical protein